MRPVCIPAVLAALLSLAGASYAAAPAQAAYAHAVDCASHVAALQSAGMREGGKAAADAPKLDVAVQRMRASAVAAGAAASVPADQVQTQIDRGRDRLVKTLDQRDAAKLKQARQEIGLNAISCMLDEAGKALKQRTGASNIRTK